MVTLINSEAAMSSNRLNSNPSLPTLFKCAELSVSEHVLPMLHHVVDLEDLHPDNNKLLSDDEIEKMKAWFAANPTATVYKGNQPNKKNYSVVRFNENDVQSYHAIYKGYKHNKHIGYSKWVGEAKADTAKIIIKLIQDLDTGRFDAIKIKKDKTKFYKDDDVLIAKREISNLRKLNRLIGTSARMDSHHQQQLVGMQLANGMNSIDYYDVLTGNITMDMILVIMHNISRALSKFHQSNLIHADLKPDNVLVDPITLECELIDVEFSRHIKPPSMNFTINGTSGFLDPVIQTTRTYYTEATDIFALGATLGQLADLALLTTHPLVSTIEILKIVDESSEPANSNQVITDKPIRDQVIQFLKAMQHSLPYMRPKAKDCEAFFLKIMREVASRYTFPRKIGMVDINELQHLTTRAKKVMIVNLQQMDEVWLFDNHSHSPQTPSEIRAYYQIAKQLQAEDIQLTRRFFKTNTPNASLTAVLDKIKAEAKLLPIWKGEYFFISTNKLSNAMISALKALDITAQAKTEHENANNHEVTEIKMTI